MNGDAADRLGSVRRRIVPVGGAKLAVFEFGVQPGPGVSSVLLLHGFPDDHRMWLPVIEHLAGDFHVIAYDTRNAGESWVQVAGLAPFQIRYLVDDFYAALQAVGVSRVHVLAHDWGSVQAWAVARDERASETVASVLAVSGPDTAHLRRWYREQFKHWSTVPRGLNQLAKSWYIWFFQVPKLPELVMTKIAARLPTEYDRGHNAVRGIALYRANAGIRRLGKPEGLAAAKAILRQRTEVPVLLVNPSADRYVSPALSAGVKDWAPNTELVSVAGGHWWPVGNPEEFAAMSVAWIDQHQ